MSGWPKRVPRAAWGSAAAALVLVGGYFAFHALFVLVSRTVEMPLSGPAKYDDYYVLRHYLQARGLQVRTVRDWPQPVTDDTAVLWFSGQDVPRELRSWLAAGGRLWSFSDPDAVEAPFEWRATEWFGDSTDATDAGSLADAGVAPDACVDCDAYAANAEDAHDAEYADDDEDAGVGEGVDGEGCEDADDDWHFTSCESLPDGCLEAGQFRYGDGCLTLVRAYGLGNDQVRLGKTPARIDALLQCGGRPTRVLIVSSLGSPWFGQLLYTHAPWALLAACVLLLLWLWRAGRHHGPRVAPRPPARRQLLEHIGAVGTLAGRTGTAPLVAAARQELRQQLLVRVPHGQALGDGAFVRAVAEATEVPESTVHCALFEPPDGSPGRSLAIARAIQALWRTI